MSRIDCDCPPAAALSSVSANSCGISLGKIGKIIIQQLDDTGNLFENATNGIELESSWSALPDALDSTKVVVTPILEEVVFNEPETLEDSENLDGAPIAVAEGTTLVTAMIRNPAPADVAALRDAECFENLTVYFVDNNGNFLARQIGSDHVGIKISRETFLVKSPSRDAARVSKFRTMIQFHLPAEWFDTVAKIAPEAGFDPLTEIVAS
jgi:hypothetical protein